MIVVIGMFLLQSFLTNVMDIALTSWLGLSFWGLTHGLFYQVLTYPLLSNGLFAVMFNSLLFWWIGGDLERRWGGKLYLLFMAVAMLAGGFAYSLYYLAFPPELGLAPPLIGLSGIMGSMLVAYAFIFPEQRFAFMLIFPIKAKYFALILVGIELYTGGLTSHKALALSQLSSILCSWAYMYFVLKDRNFPWDLSSFFKKKDQKKKSKAASHLRIIKEDTIDPASNKDQDGPPKYWH